MDIRLLARRHHEPAAQSSNTGGAVDVNQAAAQAAVTAQPSAANATQATTPAAAESADRPAAISRFTPAGRLLHALQSFEDRHPEETKQILGNIADRLRSDAERAGPFSERLNKWADRFQAAADSGDMSKLMPRTASHFGMRAYQQAEQPDNDATVEHVASTAEAQSGVVTPAAVSGAEPASTAPAAPGVENSEVRTQPVTVPDSSKVESGSDVRSRPVTVPESAKVAEDSTIRSGPVTVPESSKVSGDSDMRNRPVTVPES